MDEIQTRQKDILSEDLEREDRTKPPLRTI